MTIVRSNSHTSSRDSPAITRKGAVSILGADRADIIPDLSVPRAWFPLACEASYIAESCSWTSLTFSMMTTADAADCADEFGGVSVNYF